MTPLSTQSARGQFFFLFLLGAAALFLHAHAFWVGLIFFISGMNLGWEVHRGTQEDEA